MILVVVLAGCFGGGLGGGGGDAASGGEQLDAGGGAGTAAADAGAGAAGGARPQVAVATTAGRAGGNASGGSDGDGTDTGDSGDDGADGRALVRTGNATIAVNNSTTARGDLVATARDLGGFVADSRVRNDRIGENRTRTRIDLVLRVPAGNFTALVERTKQLGEVRHSSTSTRDVAGQLIDLQARLENLRAQRDRLRDLYQNASDTEGVLAVQERLSEVQAEIEQIEARLTELQGRVALSTLGVELVEPAPEAETAGTSVAWYETGAVAAFLDSVAGVATTLRAIVVALAYLAPYLLVFGVPALLAVVLYRRRFDWGRADDEQERSSSEE